MRSETQDHAYYLGELWVRPREAVEVMSHELGRPELQGVELLVGTGISGTVLLPWLSDLTGIPFAIVRKDGASNHSNSPIEGVPFARNGQYVIVDDFVSEGDTVDRVVRVMKRRLPGWECVGVLLYAREQANRPQACTFGAIDELPVYGLLSDVRGLWELRGSGTYLRTGKYRRT
jgi:adenine/guanine phosphoribosyltransferase-like PRPP-binding protein